MPNVFIIQASSNRDFSDAERFGKVRYLLPDGFQIARSPVIAEDKLKRRLSDFKDDDHLLLTGDPILIGLSVMIAGMANRGRVKTLKWDRRDGGRYIPIQLDVFRSIKDEEEMEKDDGEDSPFGEPGSLLRS